uniref:DNA-directed RNA polymerase subunit n=1 Tax=Stygiella incarcerata TaxID=1712417 RepID=A0A192ZI55_9EUKA|nr:DNA-directed RNA polymerase II subunit RPB1 [Stygiella incarcerata]
MSGLDNTKPPLRRVKYVQFGIVGPEEIKRMSVAEITIPSMLDKDQKFLLGGVMDPRLGPPDAVSYCQTDFGRIRDCPGHFGHIELAYPVFHHGFLKVLVRILRCVCEDCSTLLLKKGEKEYSRIKSIKNPFLRLKQLSTLCKDVKECPSGSGCCVHGTWSIRQLQVNHEERSVEGTGASVQKRPMDAREILEILRRISDEDSQLMGLNPPHSRPEWLMMTVFPVPPPAVRPSVLHGANSRGQDDLTHKIADILKANRRLKSLMEGSHNPAVIAQAVTMLQYHVSTFNDNEIASQQKSTHSSGRPLKTIRERLRGKEGRIRANLMGKRVNFSARTVITADPNISIDEVGVPRSVAKGLTFPDRVTHLNRKKFLKMLDKPEIPIACVRGPESAWDLKIVGKHVQLSDGYVVERHLQDSDVILFNRQPTLHKMSMMGHRVRILPYSTFRLNLSVTSPYNADFDGDEMNLHVPQSLHGVAELTELMMTHLNIVSAQGNRPVMGLVQDSLLGSWRITHRNVFIPRDLMMNCLMYVDGWRGDVPPPAILKPTPLWTGKQLFSMALPDEINFERDPERDHRATAKIPDELKSIDPRCNWGKDHWMDVDDSHVIIEKGILISGRLNKGILGTSAGGLVHVIFNQENPDKTKEFLNKVQKIVNFWLMNSGFSMGLSDAVADKDTRREIDQILRKAEDKVRDLTETYFVTKEGKMHVGLNMEESFEQEVNSVLNQALAHAGEIASKRMGTGNKILTMVNAGSKGSKINISQIIACVGQVNVEGKRIRYGFDRRTLPHFQTDDKGPGSRGFVFHPYILGLSPSEFFFHAMGGREGLIDTAVKTAETGYIQRRLIKAMEDAQLKYDGTVRDTTGRVIQFLYGEDGMDGVKIEQQKYDAFIRTVREAPNGVDEEVWDEDRFEERFKYEYDGESLRDDFGKGYMRGQYIDDYRKFPHILKILRDEYDQLLSDREEFLKLHNYVSSISDNYRKKSGVIAVPLNVARLIENARKQHSHSYAKGVRSDMKPEYVIAKVEEMIKSLQVVRMVEGSEEKDPLGVAAQSNAIRLFSMHLRSQLASKRVLKEYRLKEQTFLALIADIKERFARSMGTPGEMVGALAAQSIGEPATQMTLNTFHFAGVSSKNVTLGVPRLKELINVSSALKTPTMQLYLPEEHSRDEEYARQVQRKLQYTTVKDMTIKTQIFFSPDARDACVEGDESVLELAYIIHGSASPYFGRTTPWLLRIVLDAGKLNYFELDAQSVSQAIENTHHGDIACLFSHDSEEPVILLRQIIQEIDEGRQAEELDGAPLEQFLVMRDLSEVILDDVKMCGIEGIPKVLMDRETAKENTRRHLLTEGTNVRGVLKDPTLGIDYSRVHSNSIVEVREVLGIEAVRHALLKEMRKVIEFDGSYVNYRHLSLLCEVMTARGFLLPITRHGINQPDIGPLMRCSFEESVEILLESAVFGDRDLLRGVSGNVMLGQLAPIGTGCFDVMIDPKELEDVEKIDEELIEANLEEEAVEQSAHDFVGDLMTPLTGGIGTDPLMTPRTEMLLTPGIQGFLDSTDEIGNAMFAESVRRIPGGSYGDGGPLSAMTPVSPAVGWDMTGGVGGGSGGGGAYSHYVPMSGGGGSSPAEYPLTSPHTGFGAYGGASPSYADAQQSFDPASPQTGYGYRSGGASSYSPSSPVSHGAGGSYSPSSPVGFTGIGSTAYSPSSPQGGALSYSPSSPQGDSYSPGGTMGGGSSPSYSPASPSAYGPGFSPAGGRGGSASYSPSSPTSR